MDNKKIGNRITKARELNSLNKKELAKRIGVADSTIKRYEDGEIEKIKLPIIESIANVLNVNPMWIIGKSDDMNIKANNQFILKDTYFSLAKEAQESGIDPDDIRLTLETIKRLRGSK